MSPFKIIVMRKKPVVVDVSEIFKVAGICYAPVNITQTTGMYPHKPRLEDNWSYYTAVGLTNLFKLGVRPRTAAIVGIGSGVEGVAATKVFRDSLRTLTITDVDNVVVNRARENITDNLTKPTNIRVRSLIGSFCEPLTNQEIRADLIHANIPNLPTAKGTNLRGGAEKGTFLRPKMYLSYNPPKKYIELALGAQYAYIKSAIRAITVHGSVITEVGGRVPLFLLKELFEENGIKCEEVLVGFKEQTEALIDFTGYHRFEEEYGVEFDFYLYKDGLKTLRDSGISGNITDISGGELKRLLKPYRVTAGKAIELFHKGIAVGHTVHILKGTRV